MPFAFILSILAIDERNAPLQAAPLQSNLQFRLRRLNHLQRHVRIDDAPAILLLLWWLLLLRLSLHLSGERIVSGVVDRLEVLKSCLRVGHHVRGRVFPDDGRVIFVLGLRGWDLNNLILLIFKVIIRFRLLRVLHFVRLSPIDRPLLLHLLLDRRRWRLRSDVPRTQHVLDLATMLPNLIVVIILCHSTAGLHLLRLVVGLRVGVLPDGEVVVFAG